MVSLLDADFEALSGAINSRQISVSGLTAAYIDRIGRLDGKDGLNAVSQLDKTALAQARALDDARPTPEHPLFGLPILVKENIDVAGLVTSAGSPALADNVAARDAPVIANLRRRGAVILGKTNMTEFANYTTEGMPGGFSALGGQVRHAYDRKKNPSGSSTGSAVAVSAGLCAAAVGTDTSFSVVGCATENGVTGLKPPVGVLSTAGIVPIAHTLDSAGAMTRRFADACLLCSCMRDNALPAISAAKPDALRIAVNTYNSKLVSKAQRARYDALFDRLKAAGAAFSEISQPYVPAQKAVMQHEFRHDLEQYLAASAAGYKRLSQILAYYQANARQYAPYGLTLLEEALEESSGTLTDKAYMDALAERQRLRAEVMAQLSAYDACVMTGPTNVMHFTGLPSLALRLGMARDGTPKGIILYGADEMRLYAAALTIEGYCERVTPPVLTG